MKLHAKITTTTMDGIKWEREWNALSFRNCRKLSRGASTPISSFCNNNEDENSSQQNTFCTPVNRTTFVLESAECSPCFNQQSRICFCSQQGTVLLQQIITCILICRTELVLYSAGSNLHSNQQNIVYSSISKTQFTFQSKGRSLYCSSTRHFLFISVE